MNSIGPRGVFGASYAGAGKFALVGQGGALISPGAGPGLAASGAAQLYARGVTIDGGSEEGVTVGPATKLQLENASILNNKHGGILVNGGTLALRNTLVSGNGPGDFMNMGILWGGIRMQSPAPGTLLDRVSITDNKAAGISCSARVQGTGVLATGNPTADITNSCGFTSCATAGPACGVQP